MATPIPLNPNLLNSFGPLGFPKSDIDEETARAIRSAKIARGWSIGIMVFVVLVIIAFFILMFYWYRTKTVVFAPFIPEVPDRPVFYPLGDTIVLTQEQIDKRNAIIEASVLANE